MPLIRDDRLLVGLEGPDDAAVYRLDSGEAIAATLDFFTPLVDDPGDFGAIAAANALSDLYAMRARPLFALNILAVPADGLPPEVVRAILEGATDVCREAGVPIAGGHSIDDPEPKFGLVAIGLADPDALWTKRGARPGDALILGKALGTGIVTTAHKREVVSQAELGAAVASMRRLNREAADVLDAFQVRCATDVTGFGLLGHLLEVCRASGVDAAVRASAPAILAGAERLAEEGCVPGGTNRNRRAAEAFVTYDPDVPETRRIVLNDAQTSGGLLAAVPRDRADAALAGLLEAGYAAARVGFFEARAGEDPHIAVTP